MKSQIWFGSIIGLLIAMQLGCQKNDDKNPVSKAPEPKIEGPADELKATELSSGPNLGSFEIKVRGDVEQEITINSDLGDKVVCASSPRSNTFHIWGLRKNDDYKTTVLIDIGNKDVPKGKVSFNKQTVETGTHFMIVTRPDEFYWAPADVPACEIEFSDDKSTLKGKFDCKNLVEVGNANSGGIKASFKGSFECVIQNWL